MLIAIVQNPIPKKLSKKEAIARAEASLQTYVDLGAKGLIRKDYLSGETTAGGVYLWESRQAAEAWFTDKWYDRMEQRLGARPTLTLFDHYVTIDNAAGEVRVDGTPITLEVDEEE